mgnify:CR=1 FL=1
MIDGRVFILLFLVALLWCFSVFSSRVVLSKSDRINVGAVLGRLTGSRTRTVDRKVFGLQLGYLSIIFWYLALVKSTINYFADNAFVLSILLGVISGLLVQQILRLAVNR